MGAEFPGPAEDVVLAWILRLGEGRDPGEAAKRLITDYELDREPPPTGACGRLVAILRETAAFPTGRITRHLCQPSSEEHTSDPQSLMRNTYAVFCSKKKKRT